MPINPNRVTIYLPDDRRAKAQQLAEQLTAEGVPGLLDGDGQAKHSALYLHLITVVMEYAQTKESGVDTR